MIQTKQKQFLNNAVIITLLAYLIVSVIDIGQALFRDNDGGIISATKVTIIVLIQLITLLKYILLLDKPILSLLALMGGQILSTIYSMIDLNSIKEGINNNILSLLVITLFILIHMNISLNKVDKKSGFKQKFIDAINISRRPLKVKWWAKLIIYSTLITVVMTISRSDILTSLSNDNGVRLYGAVALVIPTIIILSILTTSELAYELLWIKLIIEIYTIYKLYLIDSIVIKDLVYWLVQLGVLIWITKRLVDNKEDKKEEVKETVKEEVKETVKEEVKETVKEEV